MRILITGSEGTLGRVLKAELRKRGHEVYGCDLQHCSDPDVKRADVAEYRQVWEVFNWCRPAVVYHLAAEFGRNNGAEYPEQLWRTNQLGTHNVIDLCCSRNVQMVLAGSSEAYGESSVWVDHQHDYLQEAVLDKFAAAHWNEYALSKYVQERQVFIAAQTRGLKAVVTRYFNAYGPGEHYSPYRSVVCLFTYRLMHGLPITVYRNYHRVFMWVGDWCQTVANVSERFEALTEHGKHMYARGTRWSGTRPTTVPVYNIGGSEYLSVEEMKDKIIRLLGGTDSKITYLDAEKANVTNKRPDISAAQADLDHDPRTTLDEGLPLTIDWMRKVYGTKRILEPLSAD